MVIGLFIVSFQSTSGQEADKPGSWYVYNGFINFSPKLELFLESPIRTDSFTGRVYVYFQSVSKKDCTGCSFF